MPFVNGYSYRRAFVIDHTKCGTSNSLNFPVLVSVQFPDMATVANFGKVVNPNGYDIVFTSDILGVNRLPHEIETYNSANGSIVFWVQLPLVSSSIDTAFYMFYGNASIGSSQENKTSVWDSNYKGVWHLPNGTTLTANDSTSNANNGTNNGATATAGQIDGAASFNGSSNYISVPASTSLNNLTSAFTVSAWINQAALQNYNAIITKVWGNTPSPFDFWIDGSGNTNFYIGNGYLFQNISTTISTTGSWVLIDYLYNGSTISIYKNGTLLAGPTTVTAIVGDTGNPLMIGSRNDGVTHMNGSIDEGRVSNIARSADWIQTEYNNQFSPSTFYTVGPAMAAGHFLGTMGVGN